MIRPLQRILLPVLSFAILGCGDLSTNVVYTTQDYETSVLVNGTARWYRVHIPDRPSPGPKAPLVLAFHGFGQKNFQLEAATGLNAAADAYGAIVVYPASYYQVWDINGEQEELLQVYDLDFVRRIIERIREEHVVDDHRVIAVGLSNGGLFAQRLACVLSDRIAGFVAVAASLSQPMIDDCPSARPVNGMYVLGTADDQFPYAGNGLFRSGEAGAGFWADRNGCGGGVTVTALPDTAHDGTTVTQRTWKGCPGNGGVRLFTVQGGGHAWPGALIPGNSETNGVTSRNLSANDAIMRFVQTVPGR